MPKLPSYAEIWAIVDGIPPGCVATYGQIAKLVGHPRQARYIGYALHALPANSDVAWHRVINARGEISFPRHSAAYREQRARLLAEGVEFSKGVVNLHVALWQPDLDEMLWGS